MAENSAPQQLRSNFPLIAISSALPQQMSGVSGQAHFQIGRGYQITPPNPSDVGQGYLSALAIAVRVVRTLAQLQVEGY